MSKNNETSPTLKRSWFQELKAEFKKITWPAKQDVVRRSIVVIIVSVILGFIIAGVDFAWQLVINMIVG